LGFHRRNLLTEKRVLGIHAEHPTTQTWRYRRAIPQAQRLELLGQLGQARHPEPLTTEQALDAGHGTGPLLLQGFQVPRQMAVILRLHRGHLDHLPHLTLTLHIAEHHAQQLAHVQPIALGATATAVDLNGGGIHHVVGDPVPLQKPMQPEPFTPRFIATDDGGRIWETQAAFRLGDFVEYALLLPCGYRTLAWLLPMAGGEAELP